MKSWLILATILLSLVLVGSIACNPFGGTEPETTQQLVKVGRGDLTITVSGSGDIEISNKIDLTFGTAGRIANVLVKEGDVVSQGEVIAKLETDSLELALAQAKVAYTQAQVAVAQYEVAATQAAIAVIQAEINLKNAEIVLEQTIKTSTVSDIRIAQAELDTAKINLSDSLFRLTLYPPDSIGFSAYQQNVVLAQTRVQTAQDRLDAMLSGFSTDEIAVKKQQVVAAEQSLEASRQSLELTKLSTELGRQSLELAGQSREHAQKQLDKATITAPFAGTIASVDVDEGDTIMAATTIAHLIEPSRMELKVQVDEVDIPDVKPGQRAIIKVDALPDMTLEGKVSYIGLLPKKEAGVILFEVKIELAATDGIGLKGGMSASADIVITERSNVLLVPNRVIKQDSQGNTIVEVAANEQIRGRTVVTGISDGFQTEIIDGLKEGEVVVEKRAR